VKDFYPSSQQIFHEPIHPKYLPRERIIRYVPINTDKVVEIPAKQFEELIQARYLNHLAFDSEETYKQIKELCTQTLEKEGSDKRPEWQGLRYRKEVLGGEVNDVIIKWIDNRFGFGLFANKRMEVGEFIGEYVGLVRPVTYLFANVNPYCFRYPLYHIGYRIYTIDAQDMFNETSFINHCDHPNCESVVTLNNSLFHMNLVTKSVVEKGEQLTYDYGNNLWKKLS
jgi:uncharacterized protein